MFGIVQFAQEQVPKSSRLGLAFELFDDGRDDLPSLHGVVRDLSMVKVLGRQAFGLEKVDQVLKCLFGKVGEAGFDL